MIATSAATTRTYVWLLLTLFVSVVNCPLMPLTPAMPVVTEASDVVNPVTPVWSVLIALLSVPRVLVIDASDAVIVDSCADALIRLMLV